MIGFLSRSKARVLAPAALAVLAVAWPAAAGDTLPSGERVAGQTRLEPAYDDVDGTLTYLLTPVKAPGQASGHSVAPLYIVMYPMSVADTIGTMSCQHHPMDNCPDHGPVLAGLAESMAPKVYGDGVWGHDHILTAPPGAPVFGGDFDVDWLPIAVLFTDPQFASNHITTLAQLDAAIVAGQVETVPLPGAIFLGGSVASAPYDRATPVVPAAPLP